MHSEREVVAVTKRFILAVADSHSVAVKKLVYITDLSAACRKVGLFMKNLTVKKTATLGILIAITVLLAIYMTFRVGNQIKIPMKFITIFVTGALYGPLSAGIVAAISDLLNAFLVPVGPPLPQITIIEFIGGVVFGLFFYRAKNNKFYYLRAFFCSLCLFLIGLFITTNVLVGVGYFADFKSAVIIRIGALLLTFVIHMAVLSLAKKIIFMLKDLIK